MQKGQITRTIIVLALVGLAIYSLYPTLQLTNLRKEESKLVNDISNLTDLDRIDIFSRVTQGDLEVVIRDTVSGETQKDALGLADRLIKLDGKIDRVQKKAIRLGLDLQGGTYLVYEADLPLLLKNISKNSDDQLVEIVQLTQTQVEQEGAGFFTALEANFKARNLPLNRYFGKKGETNDKILAGLREEAEDAVDRTLEVLRNRIDQFGVSEPSITKQGNNRIVIELAGIKDISVAKNIISTTALLEFKLVQEPDMTWSVLDEIDRVMRAKQKGQAVIDLPKESETDSSLVADGEKAQDTQVSLSDLFGDQEETESETQEDTSILVDQKTFSDRPFTSLLRQIPNQSTIMVPQQNVRAVQRVLHLPEVTDIIPSDSEFLFGTETTYYGEEVYDKLYLTQKKAELRGEMLTDAQVQISGGTQNLNAGAPIVGMELNSEGAKIFSRITGMNIGRQLAIVLDGKVASAPVIQVKITTGSAVIEGSFGMEEAKALALVLRAGALPAPLYPITENTVGPSLGHDSIAKGSKSVVIGLILVILFMIVYYKASGIIADFALLLNILLVFGTLGVFNVFGGAGATLTLPGIAGIILTVGMAVDANVLIFERIREELRSGKTIRAAIDAGYNRAFTTILDANVTTLITAIVLYSFGTGPIKGFAFTLSIGIVASMFTAIVVTRLVFDVITSRYAIKKLSI